MKGWPVVLTTGVPRADGGGGGGGGDDAADAADAPALGGGGGGGSSHGPHFHVGITKKQAEGACSSAGDALRGAVCTR